MRRRGFLLGGGVALVAAPAIVRVATNLMPIKPLRFKTPMELLQERMAAAKEEMTRLLSEHLYSHQTTHDSLFEVLYAAREMPLPFVEKHGSIWIPYGGKS